MDMSEREINRIVSNDREWRKFLLSEIRDIKKEQGEMSLEMNTLKVKVAVFSSVFGTVFGAATAWIVSKL